MKFTTSWDDGYTLDLQLADLLTKHGCTGTFYVCPKAQHDHNMLTEAEVKALSINHEIGAHSMTHPKLPQITKAQAREEITQSKQWIEDITGNACSAFCYPYGMWNNTVRNLVQEAGFSVARTTEQLQFAIDDPLQMPTTLQVTAFPRRREFKRLKHMIDPYGPLRVRKRALSTMGITGQALTSWLDLAKALFNHGLKHNLPLFHLWGHSHEIEKYGMWNDLEQFLKHVQHAQVKHVTNGQLYE